MRARGENTWRLRRALDHPAEVKAAARPAPTPPLAARPSRLSVTAIEDWLRDPYTIYAALYAAPAAARSRRHPARRARPRHRHSRRRSATSPKNSPPGCRPGHSRNCVKLGEKHLRRSNDYPEARAFWWPRFQRIAHWFVAGTASAAGFDPDAACGNPRRTEISRRPTRVHFVGASPTASSSGRTAATPSSTTRPGSARTEKQVRTGLAPQLTLEAAILRAGELREPARRSGLRNCPTSR